MRSKNATFHGLPIFSLKEVLQSISLPPGFSADTISDKWRCVIAPSVTECEEHNYLVLQYLEAGIPILYSSTPTELARSKHQSSSERGEDHLGISLVTSEQYNSFAKPQIAVQNGWGAPGSIRDYSQFHILVHSFSEIFDPSSRILRADNDDGNADTVGEGKNRKDRNCGSTDVHTNLDDENDEKSAEPATSHTTCGTSMPAAALYQTDMARGMAFNEVIMSLQLFHRGEENGIHLPPHAEELQWPSLFQHHLVCDTATVASQKGFQSWWKINDCAECVLEAALPITPTLPSSGLFSPLSTVRPTATSMKEEIEQKSFCTASGMCSCSLPLSTATTTDNSARGNALCDVSNSSHACKLYLFGPRGSYDWFIHDDATLSSGRVACMDIFSIADEELPINPDLLPVLIVCVLEGGGPALLQPPNLSFFSLMLQPAVTIEQRSISLLWLDEVSYFLQRTRMWSCDPLIYRLMEEDFQDEEYMASFVVPLLYELCRQCQESNDTEKLPNTLLPCHRVAKEIICRRAVASLWAIASWETHFHLSESSRNALRSTLEKDNELMSRVLSEPFWSLSLCVDASPSRPSPLPPLSLKEMLHKYWNYREIWPKPGCVMRVPTVWMMPVGNAGTVGSSSCTPDESFPFQYVPVLYVQDEGNDVTRKKGGCEENKEEEEERAENGYVPIFGCEKVTPELTLKEYLYMKRMEMRRNDLRSYLRVKKSPMDDILADLF